MCVEHVLFSYHRSANGLRIYFRSRTNFGGLQRGETTLKKALP